MSARVTTLMRISLVEIISMLMPASNSAVKSFAETPAFVRIPAPTRASLPIWSSYCSAWKPTSPLWSSSALSTFAPSDLGRVNEMSVRPVAAVDEFCTIMSMFASVEATIVKIWAALPGTSGTPTTVIFASLRSEAMPEMMDSSTISPSLGLTTSVPSLLLNEDRT
jgi:hypothetical protein